MKGSRLAANSPSLIAAGQFDLAEYQIEQSLQNFSLFRTSKLLSLHHLAVLRHAQRRWADAAELCSALLRQRLGSLTRAGAAEPADPGGFAVGNGRSERVVPGDRRAVRSSG